MVGRSIIKSLGALLVSSLMLIALPANAAGRKKLIEFGWDTPSPQLLHDQVAQWQDRPFDGIVFTLSDNGSEIFQPQAYAPQKITAQIALLQHLPWGRFTDNFLQLTCGSTMRWTSDSDWNVILQQAALCAATVRAAGCQGVVFDPEPYGGNDPWDFTKQSDCGTIQFAQYAQIVRRRGREFEAVLQRQSPRLKFFMFWQYSKLLADLGPIQDPVQRDAALARSGYGLLPAFLDGMLEASNPHVQFIDGNEASYYYLWPSQFQQSYQTIRHDASLYAAPELRQKFATQERAAEAVYTDYVFNLRPDVFPNNVSQQLSPVQRDQWLESNLYSGLQTSDEYVWLYSETLHWWPKQETPPPGMIAAIADAKQKIDQNRPLGFDVAPNLAAAKLGSAVKKLGL